MYFIIRGKIKYLYIYLGDYRWWKIKFKYIVDVLYVLYVYYWFDSIFWDGGGNFFIFFILCIFL